MSQIFNVITTEFKAKGNQAIAAMGGIAGGVNTISRSLNDASRMSERFGRQWQAINTTVRYALAGGIIFGLRGVLTQLKEVQNQMGLISAIGETKTGLITGNNLTDLMAQSRQGAVQAITPINDYNNSVINLLSTVQKIPKNQITPIVTDISKAAKLAQITSEDATKAFTTMNVAFGNPTNLKTIHRMAQEFFILTREAPGGVQAGQQVITQLGQLAQVTRAAHGTPEDMFSLLLSTLRTGIPPAQAGRGLQYLIQTLAFPGQGTVQSQRALARVGITPTTQMPLQERLTRIFAHAKSLGIRGNVQSVLNLDEATLADLESSGTGTTGTLQQLGITGRGTQYLGQVFHRIHALRTALALEGQIAAGQAQKDLKTYQDARDGIVSDVNNMSKAWKRFEKQAQLQKASVAINAMALQVATAFAPILNFAAGHVVGLSEMLQRHPGATHKTALAAAAAGAAVGAWRFLGVGGIAKGFLGAKAAQDLATGGGGETVLTGLGSTPAKPMWVAVVNPQFWNFKKGVPPVPGEPGTPVPTKSGRFGGKLKALGFASIWAAAAIDAGIVAGDISQHGFKQAALGFGTPFSVTSASGWKNLMHKTVNPFWNPKEQTPKDFHMKYLEGIMNKWSPKHPTDIKEIFRTVVENINGRAYVTLDVNLQHPGGKVERKKVHIPLDLWGKTGMAPSGKGNSRAGDRSLP